MNRNKYYILYFFIFCNTVLLCQDLHLTQFYSNPIYLNPAFTGANVCTRVAGTYRNQWPAISNGYVSYLFSVDHYIPTAKSGLGVIFSNDVAGSGKLKTTTALASYAYETNLNKDLAIRAGLQLGMGSKSVNMNSLLFGDQIVNNSASTKESAVPSVNYFDSNAGALFYGSSFYIGVAAFHLNRPNESILGAADNKMPIKYSVHGGIKKKIAGEDKKEKYRNTYVTPVAHYRHQEKFDQLDLGLYFSKSYVNVGFWYRGIPIFKSYKPGYSNNDAFAVLFGISNDKFNFGYSYDFTISKLAGSTTGAHEISISYQHCTKKKKKRVLVSCPKF